MSEASRVLKPGGLFFLHEINVANPIFRFYMSYVFPLIKRIDEGIEFWLDPENLPLAGTGLCAEEVAYFTFVPDFLPAPMMGRALALEARLEASRWRRYSAHYMVVLRKKDHSDRAGQAAVFDDPATGPRSPIMHFTLPPPFFRNSRDVDHDRAATPRSRTSRLEALRDAAGHQQVEAPSCVSVKELAA